MPNASASSLFSVLKRKNRLPSPPGAALRVLELSQREDTDLPAIADVVMCDAGLSAKLLRFANSPMAALGRPSTSIREAILLLGLRTVKLTALGFSLATPDMQSQCPRFDFRAFWSESFLRGVIARKIAQARFQVDREEAFTTGLLSAVGRMALASGVPQEYNEALRAVEEEGISLIEAEERVLEVNHVVFGGQLLEEWQVPEALVQAVRTQLAPPQDESPTSQLGSIIHGANALVPLFHTDQQVAEKARAAALDVLENTLRLDEKAWRRTAEEIVSDLMQASDMFDLRLDSQTSALDLYAEAQETAAQVGMVAQLERNEAIKKNEELFHRATTDSLTGCANRAKFDERVKELARGAQRGHGHFALIMMDIDHFKRFNDTYGHQVGDLVLKRVANAARNSLREVDLLARYGGEEFAALLPHTDRKGALLVTARLRRCVEDVQINTGDQVVHVTASFGLALSIDYDVPPNADTIVADADAQLYVSKESGRNTWSYRGRSASQLATAAPSS